MSQHKPSCEVCRYAHVQPTHRAGVTKLVCRRRAPTALYAPAKDSWSSGGAFSTFPEVAPDTWCGEWEPAQ